MKIPARFYLPACILSMATFAWGEKDTTGIGGHAPIDYWAAPFLQVNAPNFALAGFNKFVSQAPYG